jgi:hypothetical protein
MKQLPHDIKGVSEDQDVRSWGKTGRPGHLKSLNFHTPFRLAHNHFIATSHRGEMLAPRLMALYDTFNSSHTSKKAYRIIKMYVSGAKKNDPAIKNPLNFQTPFRLAHNHFIATSHRGKMLALRLMALYGRCNKSR